MHKLALTTLLMLVVGSTAFAQDPKMDFFGGYSYITTDILETPEVVPGFRDAFPAGWNAAATFYAGHPLAFTGEVGGHYGKQDITNFGKVDFTYYTFLFGPKLTHHDGDKVDFYAHFLVGAARASLKQGTAFEAVNTDFTMAIGGGIDRKVSDKVAIRVMQIDLLFGQVYQASNVTVRLSAGVVFRQK